MGGMKKMRENLWSKILIFLVLCFFVMSSLSPAKIVSEQSKEAIGSGDVIVGEKLNSVDYGPGVVEHMDDCVARDLRLRSSLDTDPEDEHRGIWVIPSRGASYYPYSGDHNVINKWGDTMMGIGFPTIVDIHGAWFAGQGGGETIFASGIRALGYRNGEHVQTTDWFEDIDDIPSWFEMNLEDVDRVVFEATPVYNGAGWYAMDDLTYSEQEQTTVVDFEDCSYKQKLTNSDYADLTWETGTGSSYREDYEALSKSSSFTNNEELSTSEEYQKRAPINNPATAPTLLNDYQGVIRGDATSWSYPPDTCGAAGPNHFVEVVNRNFAVYNKSTGEELINILLGAFLPGSNGDPRVLYDQYSDRWFIIVCDFNTKIFLAVSKSDDPTGEWFKCDFVVSQGADAGKWPDYPTLGVDEDGVYTAAYMIGGGNGMSIFALDKAPLIAEDPYLGDIYAFRTLPWEGAIQPVHTFGTTDGEYFVSRGSATSLRVRVLTGLSDAPVLTELGFATIPSHTSPPDAPALGSTVPLDTVGHRLMNAVYRDGYIWTAHCIGLGGKAASRWYKVKVSDVTLDDYGTIEDSVLYYYFPTIMVNGNGDAIMGFSGSCNNQYAAAYYTGRSSSDPPGEMADPVLLKEGEATYNLIDGYGRNRWGDYSLCSLDPVKQTLWTNQEYAHSHNETGVNRWGTWVAELAFNQPPETPVITDGPNEGINNVEYEFTAVTTDYEEDPISYKFDWGDGTFSDWIGPYPSGTPVTDSHSWEEIGTYNIRVKAKDDFGESDWSIAHPIDILLGPALKIDTIKGGFFRVKTVIKNIGTVASDEVTWSINLDGGTWIGEETRGTIPSIPAGAEEAINSNFILGFGDTKVTVNAEISEGSDVRQQNGKIFLFYITVYPGG
jgi:hypothetical protein